MEILVKGNYISLGKQGENLARTVVFDISNWIAEYGEGSVQLIVRREGDIAPYPVVVKREGNLVKWDVTSVDTAKAGEGEAELSYLINGKVAKSITYETTISKAMADPGSVPPSEQAWVDNTLQAAARVEEAQKHGPKIVEGYWYVWNTEIGDYENTGVKASGGGSGTGGADGKSAYEIAVEHGFVGTEEEWILSLKGEPGKNGKDGAVGPQGPAGKDGVDGKDGAQGPAGKDGIPGPQGEPGATGPQGPAGENGKDGKDGLPGANGEPGQDGFSPIITTSKVGKTTTITITDKDGTKTAEILDGKDGQEGSGGSSWKIICNTKVMDEVAVFEHDLNDESILQVSLVNTTNDGPVTAQIILKLQDGGELKFFPIALVTNNYAPKTSALITGSSNNKMLFSITSESVIYSSDPSGAMTQTSAGSTPSDVFLDNPVVGICINFSKPLKPGTTILIEGM